MSEHCNSDIDQYDTLLRAMDEGLLVTVNNTDYAGTPSFELRVVDSRDDETRVTLTSPGGRRYRIHRDRHGELIYSEFTDDGLSYEGDVVTFEVVGLDERTHNTTTNRSGATNSETGP